MSILDLFSKREMRRKKQGQEDVFQYDDLPIGFRVQVVHIWDDVFGADENIHFQADNQIKQLWKLIHRSFTREKCVFRLSGRSDDPKNECRDYLLHAPTSDALDLIELTFRISAWIPDNVESYDR